MVQVIDDEYSGNIFGRLGKGLAQGLSEHLPKEIERARLSSGLKQFEEESKGLTPVQQFTRLAAIPGMTPEHLYTLSPLLRQQAMRDEGNNGMGPKGETAPSGQSPRINESINNFNSPNVESPYQEQQDLATGKTSLKPLSATQAQLTPIVRRSDTELMPRAAEIARDRPYQFPNGALDALPLARQEEDMRIANLEEQRSIGEVADQLQTRIKSRLENIWGKENTEKNIPSTVQTKLLRNIEDDLANPKNKLSEQQLIDKWGEVGKRVAKADTNLMSRAKSGWLSGEYSPKKITETIDEVRKVYEEAGGLEEFQDLLSSRFNLSAPSAAYLAYPPQNAKANQYIRSIKLPKQFVSEKGIEFPTKDRQNLSIKAADELSNFFNDKDSILSYALQMKMKGLDPQAFYDRVKQNRDAGLFTPNARQREELQRGFPALPSLGDIYLFTLKNQDKLVE